MLPLNEEVLAQLRTAIVDLLHLVMCSLAYGRQPSTLAHASILLSPGMTTVSSRWCNGIALPDVVDRLGMLHDHIFQQCSISARDMSLLLRMLAGDKPGGGAFSITLTLE